MHHPVPLDADRVVVAGDWHGDGTAARTVIEWAADIGITTVLHVGDLGIGPWPRERKSYTKLLDRYLEKFDSHLLVAPGNHENWDRIDAAPLDPAGMQVLSRRVRALPRGHRFTLGGRTFGSIGGAVSVDVGPHRVAGRTWWPQEEVTDQHVAALGDEPLDVFISHDVPTGVPVRSSMTGIPADVLARADAVRDRLAGVLARTHPALAFSGHWHQRLVHELTWPEGQRTHVHVLSEEHTNGNAVVLDLTDMTVQHLRDAHRAGTHATV